MKHFLILLLLSAFVPLFASTAKFPVPPLTGYVVDQTGILDHADRQRIEQAVRDLEEATGGQMAVAFLKTIGNTPIEDVGIALGDAWKIGINGKDNGAILIVVPSDHQMRLEIGYGWEGLINDAKAGDILRDLQPFFRRDDYAGGAVYAVMQVQTFVTGKAPSGMPDSSSEEDSGGEWPWNIIILIIGCVCFRFFFGRGGSSGGSGFGTGYGGGSGGSFSGGGGGGFGGGGASGKW